MARKSAIYVKQGLANRRERKHENRTRRDDGVMRYRDNEHMTALEVREASRERADKVRPPVSSYHEDRLRAKYLIIKFGRERAGEILDMRAELLGR